MLFRSENDVTLIEPVLKINFNLMTSIQKKQLLNQLEIFSARMLKNENEYFSYLNTTDNDVLKAMELLKKK